ncbi:lipase family protein [Planctomycetaceae bacterium SH139]
MPKVIQDVGEKPLVLHSDVRGPIADLSFLQRSLLFAELAMISYNDEAEAQLAAEAIGFSDASLFDDDGAQAYRFRNRFDCVIACRGTEPHEWEDIEADVNVGRVLAETVGKVHRGFKGEVDHLWPMLEEVLSSNTLPLWFCGHSLGAAMATICAGRCLLSHISSNPAGLYAYGSPRVGDSAYVNYVKFPYYRFVNNNDIVTRLPPAWLGYRHSGREVYFDRGNRLRQLTGWRRSVDRLLGMVRGLGRGKIDALSDHQVHAYVECILAELNAEAKVIAQGGDEVEGQDVALPAPPPLEGQPPKEQTAG